MKGSHFVNGCACMSCMLVSMRVMHKTWWFAFIPAFKAGAQTMTKFMQTHISRITSIEKDIHLGSQPQRQHQCHSMSCRWSAPFLSVELSSQRDSQVAASTTRCAGTGPILRSPGPHLNWTFWTRAKHGRHCSGISEWCNGKLDIH